METSRVQVEYKDPFGVFPAFEKNFRAHLPLRNLHWKSSSRPLRSIDSLHVELRPESHPSNATESHGRDSSSEAARTSGSIDGVAKKERRHQIPGLRQTPYLRIFFVQCEDVEIYRSSIRATLRESIAKHAATQADGAPTNGQENHDASEWLIVLVEGDGIDSKRASDKNDAESVKKSTTSRWKSKTSKPVIEKVRNDFNSEKKSSVDRVALLSVPKADQERDQEDDEGGSAAPDFSDLVGKMKSLILTSFDRRVQQYEEDIREKEQRRNMPGWNFNTFFVLKEGLARGFESVGLIEDALSNYQELASGLETVVSELLDDVETPQSTQFRECTDDLQRVLSRSLQTIAQADSVAPRPRASTADLGSRLLDTDRKPFRSLILENNISIFDFECYVFARQVTLLLRQANARTAKAEECSTISQNSASSYSNSADTFAMSGGENHFTLARVCHLSLAFISNITSRIRLDLEACRSQLVGGVNADVYRSSDGIFEAISSNMVASWVLSACQGVLAATDTAVLQDQVSVCARQLRRSAQLQISSDSPVETGSPIDGFGFPRRSSSLLFRNPPPMQAKDDEEQTPAEASLDENANLRRGLSELAGARGDVLSLARNVLSEVGRRCKGWLVGFSQSEEGFEREAPLANVNLTDEVGPKPSPTTEAPPQPLDVLNGIVNQSLQSVLSSRIKFLSLFESMTVTGLAYHTVAGRGKMIEAANADLAVLYHDIEDYEVATTYFKQISSHYSEKHWDLLSVTMLRKWSECLAALGNVRESILVSLRSLQSLAVTINQLSATRYNLRDLGEASRDLEDVLTSSLDHCFRNCNLDVHLHHCDDQDAFWLDFHFETAFVIAIDTECLCVELKGLEEDQSSNLWLSNGATLTTKFGRNTVRLSANAVTSGLFAIQKIQLTLQKLVFVQEETQSTDVLALPDARSSSDKARYLDHQSKIVHIWPHARSLNVDLTSAECIDLSQSRVLALKIFAGHNNVIHGSVDVRPATPGLRLYNADANVSITIPAKGVASARGGDISFGSVQSDGVVTIAIPYTLEIDHPELRVRTTARYTTVDGDYTFSHAHVFAHALPLAVNVQDNFKRDHLLSRFIVVSALASPVRIAEVSITGNECYKVNILEPKDLHGAVFTSQPLDLVAEILRHETLRSKQPAIQTSQRLVLNLSYQIFDREIEREAEKLLIESIGPEFRDKYSIRLSTHLRAHVLGDMTPRQLERGGMRARLPLRTYERMEWETLLTTFPPREAAVLAGCLKTFHKANTFISLRDLKSQPDTRRLIIPVDLPSLSVLQIVRMRLFHPGHQAPPHLTLGEGIFAELTIEHSRRWSQDPVNPDPLLFRYEMQPTSEDWVIGGQRSATFEAREDERRFFTVLLIPQLVGHLMLPSIAIETLAPRSSNAVESNGTVDTQPEWISCEVDFVDQTETVHVAAGTGSIDVSVELPSGKRPRPLLERPNEESRDDYSSD